MLKANKDISRFKEKFFHKIENVSRDNIILYKLLYEPSTRTNVFVIGGFLRSVINNFPPRDIDVIYNLESIQLEEMFERLGVDYKVNRMGGYKVFLNTVTIDAWTIHNNWAFRNHLIMNYENDTINKIAEGTFFNFDSLVFDLYTQHSNFKHYNDCISLKKLGIIRGSSRYMFGNPGKLNNVIRAFDIRRRTGFTFSLELVEYILKQLHNTGAASQLHQSQVILEEAGKQIRFLNLEINDIKESLNHVFSTIRDNDRRGSQFSLF